MSMAIAPYCWALPSPSRSAARHVTNISTDSGRIASARHAKVIRARSGSRESRLNRFDAVGFCSVAVSSVVLMIHPLFERKVLTETRRLLACLPNLHAERLRDSGEIDSV